MSTRTVPQGRGGSEAGAPREVRVPEPQRPVFTRNAVGRLARGIFVGRDAEMDDLRADVEDALLGRGRLVLVGGEPGIGKTSIAQEVATYAQTRGLQVLWGRCDESSGVPAYWPWVQVIRSYVRDCVTADLASSMGSGAADIGQVVSEVGERLGELPLRPATPPEEARFRLFDSITSFLRNASRRQALLVILDDVHAADKPSLLLLQFLAREVADTCLLVVALYRDIEVSRQHPLFQVLGELAREPVTRRLSLRGLGRSDIARYVELTTGFSPSSELVDAVFEKSEGNPFFAGEIVRLLATDGGLDGPDTWTTKRFAIPQGVREAIGLRLGRLSVECNRTLGLAAVVGREFAMPVLENVSGLTPDQLLGAVEEATAARVVGGVPDSPGRYAFVHGLIRETLYEESTAAQRMQVHRKVGEALEALYHADLEPHLAELAHHFFGAVQSGEARKAIDYCLRAGDRAASLMAHEEAVRQYDLALNAMEFSGISDASALVDLLLPLAGALWSTGEIGRDREVSRRAVEIARGSGTPEQLASAALGVAGWLPAFSAIDDNPTVIALLKEALAALPSDDSPLSAQVMARLAEALMLEDSHEERWSLGRRATEMARRIGDERILASVLKCTFFAVWDPAKAEERLAIGNELVALAERLADRTLALEGRIFRFFGFIELGDAPAARKEIHWCEREAEELRRAYHRWFVAVLRGCFAFMEGKLGEIEELALRANAIAETAHGHTQVFLGAQLGEVMWLQGRVEEVESFLVATIGMYPALDFYGRAALAATYCERGGEHEARAQFESLAAHDFADIPRHFMWQGTLAFLSEACAYLGDAQRAAQLYQLFSPLDGRNVLIWPTLAMGATSYFLGLLAATMGRREQAARHFEAALAMNARMGTGPWLARTQTAYGEMLLAGDGPHDRVKGLELLDRATVLAEGFSMRRLTERISISKARASGEHHDAPRRPSDGAVSANAVFRREGEYWTIMYEGNVVRVRDTKGLRCIAHLIRHAGQEFHVLELTSTIGGRSGDLPEPRRGNGRSPSAHVGFVLDPTAKAQYRRRLDALRDEEQEAERFNDPDRAMRAREEMAAVSGQLAAAIGLGGRDRSARSSAERARTTVTKGIKSAVRRIRSGHPALGRHLSTHIRTGAFCCYDPDPDHPVSWAL